jgi:hypothetical protein
MSRGCRPTLVLVAALLLAAVAARAATDSIPPALRACANVKKNDERLACYDQTIERMAPESVASTLSAHVTALARDSSGALVIDLDNGQQWRQTSGASSPLLEVGHEVTITRAALNTFRMSTPSGRALKVKRVR